MAPANLASLRPALRWTAISVAVLVVALALAALFLPWNALRGVVAAYVGGELHRDVSVGHFDVKLGRITQLTLDDLSIANVEWSDEREMAHADRVVLYFSLGSLLVLEPDYVQLVRTRVLAERNADGATNWDLGGKAADLWPRLAAIDVREGALRYRDPAIKADIALTLETRAAEGEKASMQLEGRGKLRGEPFELTGKSVGLVALRRAGDPYPLTLTILSGKTRAEFDGTVVPGDPENLRGTLRLQGPDLSELYPIVPAPLPWTPPYQLAGELAHGKGLWTFRRFKGTVGKSDLSGDFKVDVSSRRARTTADLKSTKFDYYDLGGFIGLPPGDAARAKTPAQQAEVSRRAKSARVIPDKRLDFTGMREYDVEVKFQGTAVQWAGVPMENLRAYLKLENGVLRFQPLDFGVAGGHVVSNVVLDVNPAVAKAQVQVDARGVELKRIFPRLAAPGGSAGRFAGRARFNAEGNNVAQLVGSADGDAAVSMRGGEASTLALVLTNLDLARAAELMLKGDETAQIRCAVAAMHASGGTLTPQILTIDSDAMVINGEGTIDLKDERYDLRLKGDSKKPSLFALRGPIVVGGTFRTPVVGPAAGPIVARVGIAAGLAVLAPPLAWLPFLDAGDAEDVDCRALGDKAKIETGTTERIARPPAKRATAGAAAAPPSRTAASQP